MSCFDCRPDLIEVHEVYAFVSMLHDFARQMTGHLSKPGKLQMTAVHPTTKHAIYPRFEIGQIDAMTKAAINCANLGYNVWAQGRTISSDLEFWRSPRLEHTVWVFALIVDFDGYGRAPAGLRESFAIQTSPGHAHLWYLTSLSPKQALIISPRFKAAAGADGDSGIISQDYRIPGTPNYPTPKKISDGRGIESTFSLSDRHGGPAYTFERLDQLLPVVLERNSLAPICRLEASSLTIEQLDAKFRTYGHKGPNWLTDPVGRFHCKSNGQPDRSKQFWAGVRQGFRAGVSAADMHRLILSRYRHGCVRKYLDEHATSEAGEDAVARIIEKAASDFPSGLQVPRLDFSNLADMGTVPRATSRAATSTPFNFDARTVVPLGDESMGG